MIRVMIVDDHKMFRDGIKKILEAEENIQIIAEADHGKDCLKKWKNINPDVLILNIGMPIMDGIETLQYFVKKKKKPKILVLTGYIEIDYLIKAMDLGADGFLSKSADSKELKKAVIKVYQGGKWIPSAMIPQLTTKLIARDIDKEKIENLTDRELEVLQLVSVGMLNKEIGQKLEISERTVKNHLFSIFKKLECTDRTQAAIFAIRNKIVII